MTQYPIEITAHNSAAIQAEAQTLGITHMREIAKSTTGDKATLYAMPYAGAEIRVLDTNAEPIWEENDAAEFVRALSFYGMNFGMRYEVRVIMARDDSRNRECLGQLLCSTDDAVEAKHQAESLGSAVYYGAAIVDRTAGTVDFGSDGDGRPWIEPLSAVDVEVEMSKEELQHDLDVAQGNL